jgi:hypothetical protein
MEPVKKMPSADFTIQWKEIALIGKRGKHVTCKYKLRRTANREKCQRRKTPPEFIVLEQQER